MCDREKNIRDLGERITRPIPTEKDLTETAWNGYKNILGFVNGNVRSVDGDPVLVLYHTPKARVHGEDVALCSVIGDLACSVYLLHKMFRLQNERYNNLRDMLKIIDEDHCTLSDRFDAAIKKIEESAASTSEILKSVEQTSKLVEEIKRLAVSPCKPSATDATTAAAVVSPTPSTGTFDVEDRIKTLERNVKSLRQTHLDDFQDRLDRLECDTIALKKQLRDLDLDI